MPILIAAVVLLGLAVGSFLNVVIYRVPAGLSLIHPPSRCGACGHPIRNRHNLPVLGWLLLRGRCADCRTSISPRYPLVELGTCLLFLAVTINLAERHSLTALPAYLYFAAIGISLALIDWDTKRLPNAIVLPSYPILAILLAVAALTAGDPWSLLRAAIGAAGLYALYFALWFSYPRGMGFGDVKLAGLIGAITAYLSYPTLLVAAFSAFVIGGLAGVLVLMSRSGSRKSQIPFGPFMIAGALVAIFFGSTISAAYSAVAFGT